MKTGFLILSLLTIIVIPPVKADTLKTRNLILVTLDGLRWQEVFSGADPQLLERKKYVADPSVMKQKYWSTDPIERRSMLMPFLWTVLVPKGQIYGNRNIQSFVNLTNLHHVSYPGYNELLTGYADPDVQNNDHGLNSNGNIFEFIIESRDEFKGNVAAFTSWQNFNDILNEDRNGIIVNAGLETIDPHLLLPGNEILNDIQFSLPDVFGGIRLDAVTFHMAFSYLKARRPRILYVGLDETDDFAHQGRYDHYLNSIHYSDGFIRNLWTWIQSDPQYKDQTTLMITCDHGRGKGKKSWKDHGAKTRGSDETWFAVLGPDTPATGEMGHVQYYHNQLAATLADLLGLDYSSGKPHGSPIPLVSGSK